MTSVLVTGGTGLVGRFIVEGLHAAGHEVTVTGRSEPPRSFFSVPVRWTEASLEPAAISPALFEGVDALVHAAFHHEAGKYRGGEGDDPETFRRLNVGGSLRLFELARQTGVSRAVFLSSRAVYGKQAPGAILSESMQPHPDTLYGEVKREVEVAIAAMADGHFFPATLRATGVYGPAAPGKAHKWAGLLEDYRAGKSIAPRIGTEVHGGDLAEAVRLMIECPPRAIVDAAHGEGPVFNVSDILLDRHDLLAEVQARTGCPHPLPAPADATGFNVMDTARLRALGWLPRGVLDLTGML